MLVEVKGVLAHQGGWDEILLPTLFVLALIAIPAIRDRRRRRAGAAEPREPRNARGSTCPYCDAPVGPGQTRCPRCGFRTDGR